MSVTNKPDKISTAVPHSQDTDEDELSDISETSREDENSDYPSGKSGVLATAHAGINQGDGKSSKPITEIISPSIASSTIDKETGIAASSTVPDISVTGLTIDTSKGTSTVEPNGRTISKARRIEESDTDDTTSGADSSLQQTQNDTSPLADQSTIHDHDSGQNASNDSAKNLVAAAPLTRITNTNQELTVLKKSSDHQEKLRSAPKRGVSDDGDESSDESTSSESENKRPVSNRLQFGEPSICTYREYVVSITNIPSKMSCFHLL